MEQECQRCHALLPSEMFLHYRTICNDCVERERAQDTKACTSCGVIKPKSAFPINKAAVDGHGRICRECRNRQKDAERAAAPKHYTLAECLEIVRQRYGPDVLLDSRYGRRSLQSELFQLRQHVPFKLMKRATIEFDDDDDEPAASGTAVATIWERTKDGEQPAYRVYLPVPLPEDVAEVRAQRRAWARMILASSETWAIVDTETTGLEDDCDITDIAVIDLTGKVLYTSLVRPTKPIPPDVTQKTRISNSMVARAPAFEAVYERLRSVLNTHSLLIYHADFDVPVLQRHINDYCGEMWTPVHSECLMIAYAEYAGERHGPAHRFAGQYKLHGLEKACVQMHIEASQTHRALADCRLTLALLHAMAK